jgi:SPP1 gp7 family putative phage head morphogenesis protein
MQQQGVPLIFPIDQEQVTQAIKHETKLSDDLYTELGYDIKDMSKKIAGEISRGIASGKGYGEIARRIADNTNVPLNNAMRIARTESHRIQCKSAMDAQYKAREKGADVVKEWNSYLDGKTRPHHRRLDGQIRELDEPFEVGGMKAMFPGDFGDPSEDCNCRCALLQRARWELDDEETQYLGNVSEMTDEQQEEIAKKLGIPVDELGQYSDSIVPIKARSYEDFKKKYNNIWHYEGSEEQAVNLANAEITRLFTESQGGRTSLHDITSRNQGLKLEFPNDVYKVNGFTEDVKKEVDSAMKRLNNEYDIRLNSIVVEPANEGDIFVTGYHDGVVDMVVNSNADFGKIIRQMPAKYNSGYYAGKTLEDYLAHEMAHCMLYQDCTSNEEYYALYDEVEALYPYLQGISLYADKKKSGNEALAEAFVRIRNNEEIPPIAEALVSVYFRGKKK